MAEKQKTASSPSSNVNWVNALMKGLLGGTYDQLANEGRQMYPQVPTGSQHHVLGAERLASNPWASMGNPALGFILSQLAGLGVETVENAPRLAGMGGPTAEDTMNDLMANLIGGVKGAVLQDANPGYMQVLLDTFFPKSQFSKPSAPSFIRG